MHNVLDSRKGVMYIVSMEATQMTPALENIIFETQKHFIVRVSKGFEVYEIGPTAATRCAVIGYEGDKGLERAKLEILRREE